MSYLASDAITNSRKMLEDTDSTNYTWTDSDLLTWLNQGVVTMQGLVPEFRINSQGGLDGVSGQLSASDSVPIPDLYHSALEDYVCSRAYEQDAGDTRDTTLAGHHFKRFMAILSQAGG